MSFFDFLFRTKMETCPRCLGKGHVDEDDIKRFKRELYWLPGKCAFCMGRGRVSKKMISSVSADFIYLTLDLSKFERWKLLKKDEKALQRAEYFETWLKDFHTKTTHLYYNENQDAEQFAESFIRNSNNPNPTAKERQELIEYIKRVVKVNGA